MQRGNSKLLNKLHGIICPWSTVYAGFAKSRPKLKFSFSLIKNKK